MFDLQKKLSALSQDFLDKKFGKSTDIHFNVSVEEGKGDLTTSAALQLGKALKVKPQEVAQAISSAIEREKGIDRIEVAGPGFVNVFLDSEALTKGLTFTQSFCVPMETRGDAPVVVEYSQPNIAKPLGIHHIMSTIIGQSIANLHRHLGYKTICVNHLGDWGTQFGKLAVAYQKWGKKPVSEHSLDELLALYVKFHEEAEKHSELEDEGRAAFSRLEKEDEELRAFWTAVVEITMLAIEDMYKRLHVSFDFVHGESFYEDKMTPIVEEGKKKGVFKPGKEGALIVDFAEETKLPTAVVIKSDGSTIYLTRDLATIRYRVDTWHPQALLYVVDVAQQLYFQQLFQTVRMLGWDLPILEHVSHGRMRFADKSMSTRKGNILRLEHVIDEAVTRADTLIKERGEKIQSDDPKDLAEMMGTGALAYTILSQNRKMDTIFDWDKMLSFEGNSAPYLQYTHARARSVLRKAKAENPAIVTTTDLTGKERTLVKLLLQFGAVLETARAERLPHKLTNYLYELCQAFNAFYNADEILGAEEATRRFRLGLTSILANVLKTGAELLTLRVPDRM